MIPAVVLNTNLITTLLGNKKDHTDIYKRIKIKAQKPIRESSKLNGCHYLESFSSQNRNGVSDEVASCAKTSTSNCPWG